MLKSTTRLTSQTSFSEKTFYKSFKIYSEAIKESKFTNDLKYSPNEAKQIENDKERKRKRKIIWLNSPYSEQVKTDVVKLFLKLLKGYFPSSRILLKTFNKNTVKISYSCMKNINSIISFHNKNILNHRAKSLGVIVRTKKVVPY